MTEIDVSIFNDVLGPVITGPSSSGTAGALRVARMARKFMPGFRKARINVNEHTSINLQGLKTGVAYAAGLLDFEVDDPRIGEARQIAAARGLEISYAVKHFPADLYPEYSGLVEIILDNADSASVSVLGASIGGGMAKLLEVDGTPLSMRGSAFEVLILAKQQLPDELLPKLQKILEEETAVIELHKWAGQARAEKEPPENAAAAADGNPPENAATAADGNPSEKPCRSVLELWIEDRLSAAAEAQVRALVSEYGANAYFFDAILTVNEKKQRPALPFTTVGGLSDYLEKTGANMYDAALAYEAARSGWTPEQVLDYAVYLVKAMRTSVKDGLRCDYEMSGYSKPHCAAVKDAYEHGGNPATRAGGEVSNTTTGSEMKDAGIDGEVMSARAGGEVKSARTSSCGSEASGTAHSSQRKMLPLGLIDRAIYYAMAVMELNSGMGRIVTCPTAGSSGIMPGVLLSMMDYYELSWDKAAEGLMVGGLIGMFVARLATFDGGDAACQAEISSGCAMAAAAACYLMNGTPQQILNAAVLSFESLMGLICDPVAKYPEIPCIPRNPMGAAVAFTMANMALSGYDPLIPLDEIITAMMEVGTSMPKEIRCGCSGCKTTPTALRIAEQMQKEKGFSYEAVRL